MEIKYKREDVKYLIKKYYQQYEGRDVTVSINVSKERVGIFEEEAAVVDISIFENTSLLGFTTTLEEKIKKDKLIMIFDKLLESTDYSLKGLCYDAGLERNIEGYGWDEVETTAPYFNGINLTVERKVNNNRPNCNSQEETTFNTSITTGQGCFQKKLGSRPTNSFVDHGNNEVSFIPY